MRNPIADGAEGVQPSAGRATGYAENAACASGFLEAGVAMNTEPFAMEVLATNVADIVDGV